MKVKIRLKLDNGHVSPIAVHRRIIIGEIKPFPSKKIVPECIKENFLFVEGKNFYVERPRKTAETVQEESKQMFIPVKEIRSITVLPDDFDLEDIKYEIVGSRIICKSTKEEVPIKEEGR